MILTCNSRDRHNLVHASHGHHFPPSSRGRISRPVAARGVPTDAQTTRDVARAVAALQGKQADYARRWRYYDGDHPLVYANQRLHDVFRHLDARWSENWAAVVVDSLLDRIQLVGFRCQDAAAQEALNLWWDGQDVAADAEDVAKAVAVCGEGFYLAEQDADGRARSFENSPHLCALFYSEADPKAVEMAAKWWEVGEHTRLTLYYPERFVYLVANCKRADVTGPGVFFPDPEIPEERNEWGAVPVFHFRRDRRNANELTNVMPLNDALNKLLADMMVAAEYGAYKQRWMISQVEMDRSKLQAAPNELWNIPAGDGEGQGTQVGEFSASETQNFINALDHIASRIAVITRTPKHYLLQAGDVSGEALLAMEAPLVKKAASYRNRLAVTWKHAAAFILSLQGFSVGPDDVECVWEDEHTVQPYTEALIRKTNVESGMPLVTQLRREGWSEDELDEMAADEESSAARSSTMADVVLSAASRRFSSGDDYGPYQPTQVAE